jgi:hypothetical protein
MSKTIQFPGGKRGDKPTPKRWSPFSENAISYAMKADCLEDAELTKEALAEITSDWKIEVIPRDTYNTEWIVITFKSKFYKSGLSDALRDIEEQIYQNDPDFDGRCLMAETLHTESEFWGVFTRNVPYTGNIDPDDGIPF